MRYIIHDGRGNIIGRTELLDSRLVSQVTHVPPDGVLRVAGVLNELSPPFVGVPGMQVWIEPDTAQPSTPLVDGQGPTFSLFGE